jgi:hypothetical protein
VIQDPIDHRYTELCFFIAVYERDTQKEDSVMRLA